MNISHRDIKIDNILVNEYGEVKVIDFGFAVKRNSQSELISNFCGTPTFMCPEIIRRLPYDSHKADVWALGVLFYRLVTGRYPFRGESDAELNLVIVKGEVKFDKEVSENLKMLIEGMLCKNEKQRLSLEEVLESEWIKASECTDLN